MTTPVTIMYGTAWCGDCRRALRAFKEHGWPHEYVDVEKDAAALDYVLQVNNGNQSVPTIVFPDGSVLVEPSSATLIAKIKELQK